MDLGYRVETHVSQTRLVFEWLRLYVKDSKVSHDVHYKQSREKVNDFLEKYKSSAPLDVCFKDIKGECRIANADTLDELITLVSSEDRPLSAAILFLDTPGVWTKTVALVKNVEDPHYTLIDPKAGFSLVLNTMESDVKKSLAEPAAPFGYVIVFFKPCPQHQQQQQQEEEEEEEEKAVVVAPTSTSKKRHRPIATQKKKKGVVGEMTSEESVNK